MFCPNCGVHQTDGRKFCTSCGTNLIMVSQALEGRSPAIEKQTLRSRAHALSSEQAEARRRRNFEKGIKLTIIGSAFLGIQFFSFVLALPFRSVREPFGFFSFVALVMMAVGISKIVGSRPLVMPAVPVDSFNSDRAAFPEPADSYREQSSVSHAPEPHHAFEPPTPTTSSLEFINPMHPVPSVIEAETEHLPEPEPELAPRTRERSE
jgi:zinc-ribbon domain